MKTLMILGALVAIATPAAAVAGPLPSDPIVMHITVKLSDVDLSRVAGADTVIHRIRGAAQKVCGDRPYAGDMRALAAHLACIKAAADAAVRQLNVPLVTARYARDPAQSRFAAK